MLAPNEHHGKAAWARDRCEPRVAEQAARGVGRSGSTTGRTIERFGVHRLLQHAVFQVDGGGHSPLADTSDSYLLPFLQR